MVDSPFSLTTAQKFSPGPAAARHQPVGRSKQVGLMEGTRHRPDIDFLGATLISDGAATPLRPLWRRSLAYPRPQGCPRTCRLRGGPAARCADAVSKQPSSPLRIAIRFP